MTEGAAAPRAIFVSEPAFLSAAIPGGVQKCTAEFVSLVRAAGFDVRFHPITTSPAVAARLRIRLGFEVYDRYDVEAHAAEITRAAAQAGAALVLLNQVELAPLAPRLRALLPAGTLIVVLSHGNASGDFLHAMSQPGRHAAVRARDAWRLGALLASEAGWFRGDDVDVVVCVSETERQIDAWLGARHVVVVPRVFSPAFLDWTPEPGRIGFVGTLDHQPNYTGIERLSEALAGEGIPRLALRVAGGGDREGRALERRFPFVRWVGQLDDPALREEAATWSLFVNPIFWHARGTSMKLATAIEWGIPVVTTPAGRRGYEWRDGELPQPVEASDMSRAIAALLADDAGLRDLQAQVRRVARSGPSMSELAARRCEELDLARHRRAGAGG